MGKTVRTAAAAANAEDSKGALDDSPLHRAQPALRPPVSCGIDIELIDNLPPAKDFWEEDFYRTHFTPAEIAYCLTKENPLVHFAARWCAKEALKKCDPAYLGEEMSNIELTVDQSGAPALKHIANGSAMVLPLAVSISHTPTVAAAVVVKLAFEPGQLSAPAEKQVAVTSPMDHFPRNRYGAVPALLTILALGLAIWVVVRTFF
jgi:phosphopantetheine--protein transferase-like protein